MKPKTELNLTKAQAERMSALMAQVEIMERAKRPLAIAPVVMASPLALPEREVDGMAIRHRCVDEASIIGMRQAFLRGVEPVKVKFQTPRLVHELVEEKRGTWMSDLPEELFQLAEMLATVKPAGRIFVGGLGLGVIAHLLNASPEVDRVDVFELDERVIRLCDPDLEKVYVYYGDALKAVRRNKTYDCYLLDTWQGTNEATWWSTVMPLRRAIRNSFGTSPKIHCWAEDQMIGQVIPRLASPTVPHWYYAKEYVNLGLAAAEAFCCEVGLPAWEAKYGQAVDQAVAKVKRN